MYSELLAVAYRAAPGRHEELEGERLERVLRHELAECRRQLSAHAGTGRGRPAVSDPPVDIARQIDYDLALIRLCRVHGIECDPASFTRPYAERHRLEEALAMAGVEVSAPK